MPYIKSEQRTRLDVHLNALPPLDTKGELEYAIFKVMRNYMTARSYTYTELHNTVYAAMHCADEFRRRFLDAREDQAREQNGDVC